MPVVFVHGVGTRTSPKYWSDIAMRRQLVRDFLLVPLGLPVHAVIEFAYWGDHAARFRWGHASLPSGGDEALGPGDAIIADLLAAYADVDSGRDDAFLVEVARQRSLGDALDLMVAAAADRATPAQAADVATAVKAAFAAFDPASSPDWLDGVRTDVAFLTELADRVGVAEADEEALGSRSAGWTRLRERLSRIRTAVPAATSRVAAGVARPRFHEQAATFIGDVLVYLARPGAEDPQAAILAAVASTLEAAASDASAADPLVVIAHSMGGNIVYDLLSSHRPGLVVDTFVTVGSQVGLFQELDLFAAKHPEIEPPQGRIPRPGNVRRWINVYDRNDMLGFAASRIFEGVTDFEYGTGLGLMKAHSSYFIRPSFYQRLAVRLGE